MVQYHGGSKASTLAAVERGEYDVMLTTGDTFRISVLGVRKAVPPDLGPACDLRSHHVLNSVGVEPTVHRLSLQHVRFTRGFGTVYNATRQTTPLCCTLQVQ